MNNLSSLSDTLWEKAKRPTAGAGVGAIISDLLQRPDLLHDMFTGLTLIGGTALALAALGKLFVRVSR